MVLVVKGNRYLKIHGMMNYLQVVGKKLLCLNRLLMDIWKLVMWVAEMVLLTAILSTNRVGWNHLFFIKIVIIVIWMVIWRMVMQVMEMVLETTTLSPNVINLSPFMIWMGIIKIVMWVVGIVSLKSNSIGIK